MPAKWTDQKGNMLNSSGWCIGVRIRGGVASSKGEWSCILVLSEATSAPVMIRNAQIMRNTVPDIAPVISPRDDLGAFEALGNVAMEGLAQSRETLRCRVKQDRQCQAPLHDQHSLAELQTFAGGHDDEMTAVEPAGTCCDGGLMHSLQNRSFLGCSLELLSFIRRSAPQNCHTSCPVPEVPKSSVQRRISFRGRGHF